MFRILSEPLSSLLVCWCHPFGCLWFARAVCGLFLLLFVVPLARLGCLWARGSLWGCFLVHFRDLFHVFSIVFLFVSVVEAAPQARPKTTAVANTALRPSPCSPPSLNALPVPLLRQVSVSAFFFVFFSAPFLEAPFSVLFQFLGAFGGAWGAHFSTFFGIYKSFLSLYLVP